MRWPRRKKAATPIQDWADWLAKTKCSYRDCGNPVTVSFGSDWIIGLRHGCDEHAEWAEICRDLEIQQIRQRQDRLVAKGEHCEA